MTAIDRTEKDHPRAKAGRVYIIDFDRSRQLELGPGHQSAIELPSTQCEPPLQMKSFDPYAWDVYCMGKLFEWLTEVRLYSLSFSPAAVKANPDRRTFRRMRSNYFQARRGS